MSIHTENQKEPNCSALSFFANIILIEQNGEDVPTLQMLLGRETLDMTHIYEQMEREDLERMHERASPVDRMGL